MTTKATKTELESLVTKAIQAVLTYGNGSTGPFDQWAQRWLSGEDRSQKGAREGQIYARQIAVDDRWQQAAYRAAGAAYHLAYGDHAILTKRFAQEAIGLLLPEDNDDEMERLIAAHDQSLHDQGIGY